MTTQTQIYKVEYTRYMGGTNTILVKATSEKEAIGNAKNLCATGSDFRNATITNDEYVKPRKQGFAGYN